MFESSRGHALFNLLIKNLFITMKYSLLSPGLNPNLLSSSEENFYFDVFPAF